MTLQANGQLQFLSLQALQVVANAPFPKHSYILIIQLPIFLFFSFIFIYNLISYITYSRQNKRFDRKSCIQGNIHFQSRIKQFYCMLIKKVKLRNQKQKYRIRTNSEIHYAQKSPFVLPKKYTSIDIKEARNVGNEKYQIKKNFAHFSLSEYFSNLKNNLQANNRSYQQQKTTPLSIQLQYRGDSISKDYNKVQNITQRFKSHQLPIIPETPFKKSTNFNVRNLQKRSVSSFQPEVQKTLQNQTKPVNIYMLPFSRGSYIYRSKFNEESLQEQTRYYKLKKQRNWIFHRALKQKQQLISKNLKIFKKVTNSILFIFYIKRYHRAYHQIRKRYIQQQGLSGILSKLITLKLQILNNMSQFEKYNILNQHINFKITNHDTQQKIYYKRQLINKSLNIFLKCIDSILPKLCNLQNVQLIYFLCKHGSYATLEAFNTLEEVKRFSTFQKEGYIRCDKYLQKSLIISLIFIKIIVFNILLKPQNIIHYSSKTKTSWMNTNIRIIGNIIYHLITDIQEQFLVKSDPNYKIGNWTDCEFTKKLQFSQSMSINQDYADEDELISGLMTKQNIKRIYLQDQFAKRVKLQFAIEFIHQKIARYHLKLMQYIY